MPRKVPEQKTDRALCEIDPGDRKVVFNQSLTR